MSAVLRLDECQRAALRISLLSPDPIRKIRRHFFDILDHLNRLLEYILIDTLQNKLLFALFCMDRDAKRIINVPVAKWYCINISFRQHKLIDHVHHLFVHQSLFLSFALLIAQPLVSGFYLLDNSPLKPL